MPYRFPKSRDSEAMLKIEKVRDGGIIVIRLIGDLDSQHIDELRGQLQSWIALDLDQVTLVDVEIVRFLGAIELAGVELRNCSPYIREWIEREQDKK